MNKTTTNTIPYNNNWQLFNDNFKALLKQLKNNKEYIKVSYKTMKENNEKYGKIFVTTKKELTEIDFINTIKHELKNEISNTIFDKHYNGNNYNNITNNINNYITVDIIKEAIQNNKDSIKNLCKFYELPCKIELGFHEIIGIVNNNEYELYTW